jgi:hypothetical protein
MLTLFGLGLLKANWPIVWIWFIITLHVCIFLILCPKYSKDYWHA